jgi:hypothetical protein
MFGKGRAYSIEWLFKKVEKYNGWINYNLLRTESKDMTITFPWLKRMFRDHLITMIIVAELLQI